MKTASLYKNQDYLAEKPAISVLLETDFTKEIRILFKEGQRMKEHKTPFPIVVHVVTGAIDFGVKNETLTLKAGDLISLEGNEPHDLLAKQDSVVRLTLTKADQAKRVSQVVNE